ncbi:hypothetical protein [Gracilibacillus kekensis]|uniref:Uncharacterized protein n=1 Tax=Gracilibacillus kekensis TaxID=1027249 RepID=A0A1M7PWV4_9BACI|nr:hypothetical protein [Gracilibacillus kekensis]SHN22097.1 hypothetical protein SAMN05216179_2512 [Gracilibacillus kekensis]
MIVSTNVQELQNVQKAIERLQKERPAQFQQFKNIIELTRQLQYGFQYLGCLLMDESISEFQPKVEDSYVQSIFQREVNELKKAHAFDQVKELLATYKEVSYDHICKIVL